MKTIQKSLLKVVGMLIILMLTATINAQESGWNAELEGEAKTALDTLLAKMPKLESYKEEAFGYAVFPHVTKAAVSVGIALGNGVVYQGNELVGTARLKQVNLGYQLGGQQYMEVIFFKDEEVFEKFKNGKLKLDAQASAVAMKSGASFDVAYQDGVAIFTATKKGLKVEASIGGQHFRFKAK